MIWINRALLNLKIFLYPFWLRIRLVFIRPNYGPKVFCIGYQKTGTTSVGYVFKELGFSHFSWYKPIYIKYRKGNIKSIIRFTSKFDSFDDLPWSDRHLIPILVDEFPNSKFINLVRDIHEWKKSYKKYFKKKDQDVEEAFREYEKHQDFVRQFFANRQDQLITVSVKDDNCYIKIAEFLGRSSSVLELKKMPHLNKS